MAPMDKAVPEGNDISILVVSCDKSGNLSPAPFGLLVGVRPLGDARV
jgi:hypothetical protein